jgi:hypothetical protein
MAVSVHDVRFLLQKKYGLKMPQFDKEELVNRILETIVYYYY